MQPWKATDPGVPTSQDQHSSQNAGSAETNWTALLSGLGTADLQEMLNARFGSNINLLVYTGGCKGWKNNVVSSSTSQIWQVKGGQLVKIAGKPGSVPMTDPSVLSQYIQWCAQKYPASRYRLILWDHGGDRSDPHPARRPPDRLRGDRAGCGLVLYRLAHCLRPEHFHAHHRSGQADCGRLCRHLHPEVPWPAHPLSVIDLAEPVHPAKNLGAKEGDVLAQALLGDSFGRISGLETDNSRFLSHQPLSEEELALAFDNEQPNGYVVRYWLAPIKAFRICFKADIESVRIKPIFKNIFIF